MWINEQCLRNFFSLWLLTSNLLAGAKPIPKNKVEMLWNLSYSSVCPEIDISSLLLTFLKFNTDVVSHMASP